MNLFRWLQQKTCYTFAIAVLSVMGGQIASFYGYFYFHFYVQQEGSVSDVLPSNMALVALCAIVLVSVVHYALFGLFRVLGPGWELPGLRFVNDNVQSSRPREGMNLQDLSRLLKTLSRFPLWNTGSVVHFLDLSLWT